MTKEQLQKLVGNKKKYSLKDRFIKTAKKKKKRFFA
jgi:hypothetical protein